MVIIIIINSLIEFQKLDSIHRHGGDNEWKNYSNEYFVEKHINLIGE